MSREMYGNGHFVPSGLCQHKPLFITIGKGFPWRWLALPPVLSRLDPCARETTVLPAGGNSALLGQLFSTMPTESSLADFRVRKGGFGKTAAEGQTGLFCSACWCWLLSLEGLGRDQAFSTGLVSTV